MKKIIQAILVLGLTICFAQASGKQLPEYSEEGLRLVPDSRMAAVYAKPGVDLAAYSQVNVMNPFVAFEEGWERDQRSNTTSAYRVTSSDIERIKKDLANEFRRVFTDVLENGGYAVVDTVADNVLVLRPAIIDLDVKAPKTARSGPAMAYVDSVGEMTLYLELYDAVTEELIAKALDRKVDPANKTYYTWNHTVSNQQVADQILRGWAGILLKALDEARAVPAKH